MSRGFWLPDRAAIWCSTISSDVRFGNMRRKIGMKNLIRDIVNDPHEYLPFLLMFEDIRPVVDDLVRLAGRALERAQGVYLWNCV
jgi:hypothetical protein